MMRSAIACSVVVVASRGGDDGEFVAAEPRDQIVAAQRAAQPLRDVADQLVADRMAERVVDVLEVIEVDVEHRRRRPPCAHLRRCVSRAARRKRCGWAARTADRAGRDGAAASRRPRWWPRCGACGAKTSPASSAKPASATAMNGTTLLTISAPGCFGVQAKRRDRLALSVGQIEDVVAGRHRLACRAGAGCATAAARRSRPAHRRR